MARPTAQSGEYSPATLHKALATSISGAAFTDTAYFLFSRRKPSAGVVGSPRAVYASSHVMRAAADHFHTQLSGHFSTDDAVPTETADYGYGSDSDLEDEEDENQCVGELANESKGKEREVESQKPSSEALRENAVREGVKHILFIPDVAAVTWHALVFFIYTGKISFAPLRSTGEQARRGACRVHRAANPELPELCSPKSMYRLADMVGLDHLKELAAEEIQKQLSHECIIDELFSHFSAAYPDVLTAQLTYLYAEGRMAEVLQKAQRHVASALSGHMPHAETVLSAMLATLSALLLSHPGYPAPTIATLNATASNDTTSSPSIAPSEFKFSFSYAANVGPSQAAKKSPKRPIAPLPASGRSPPAASLSLSPTLTE